jgi:hypothetical protein
VIVVSRAALRERHLVYVACANKLIKYRHGRSRIVYIGTTKNGIFRIAASAARTAKRFLYNHGVRSLECFVVACHRRPGIRTWKKLERALLLAFKDVFGQVPIGNTQGKNAFWDDELSYFKLRRLRTVVSAHSSVSGQRRRRKRRHGQKSPNQLPKKRP